MALVSGIGSGKGVTATKTATSSKNTTSASRAAAQVADQKAAAAKALAAKKKTTSAKPTTLPNLPGKPKVTPKPPKGISQLPMPITNDGAPVGTPMVGSAGESLGQSELTPAEQWTLESDPLYQMALAGGQSEFNYSRNAALAEKQANESAGAAERKSLDIGAAESRRRLAGNYAARGMAGGFAGAASQAEARANAEQIAARTSIQNKLDALNQQFLSNYGAVGSDWTGTLAGQQYKSQAAQQALSAQLARYGSI